MVTARPSNGGGGGESGDDDDADDGNDSPSSYTSGISSYMAASDYGDDDTDASADGSDASSAREESDDGEDLEAGWLSNLNDTAQTAVQQSEQAAQSVQGAVEENTPSGSAQYAAAADYGDGEETTLAERSALSNEGGPDDQDVSDDSGDGGGGGGWSVGIPGTDKTITTNPDEADVASTNAVTDPVENYAAGYSDAADDTVRSAEFLADGNVADSAGAYGEALVELGTGGNAEEWRQEALDQEGGLEANQQSIRQNLDEGGIIGNVGAFNDALKVGLDVGVADNPTGPNLQDATVGALTTVTPASDAEDVAGGFERTHSAWREMRSIPADAIGLSEDSNLRRGIGWATTAFIEDPLVGGGQFLTGADAETGETNTRAEPVDLVDYVGIGGVPAVRGGARAGRGLLGLLRGSDDAASTAARAGGTGATGGSAAEEAATTAGDTTVPPFDDFLRTGARLSDEASSGGDDVADTGADLGRVEAGTSDDVTRSAEEAFDPDSITAMPEGGARSSPGTSIDDTSSGIQESLTRGEGFSPVSTAEEWAQTTPDDIAAQIGDSIPGGSTVGTVDEGSSLSDDALEAAFGGTDVGEEGATLSDDALVETFGGTNAIDDASEFASRSANRLRNSAGNIPGVGEDVAQSADYEEFGWLGRRMVELEEITGLGPGFDETASTADEAATTASGADEGSSLIDEGASGASAADDAGEGAAQMGPVGSFLDSVEETFGIGAYADEGGAGASAFDNVADDATDDDVASAFDDIASGDDSVEESFNAASSTDEIGSRIDDLIGGSDDAAEEFSSSMDDTLDQSGSLLDDAPPGSSAADDGGSLLNPRNWSRTSQAIGGLGLAGIAGLGGMDLFGIDGGDFLGGAQSGDYGSEVVETMTYDGQEMGQMLEVYQLASGGEDTVGFAITLPPDLHEVTDISEYDPAPVLSTSGEPTEIQPLAGSGQRAIPQGRFGSRDQAADAWGTFETWLDENLDSGGDAGSDSPRLGSSGLFSGSFDPPGEVPVGQPFNVPYDIGLASGTDSAEARVLLAIPLDGQWTPMADINLALNQDNTNRSGEFTVQSGWGGVEPGEYDIAMVVVEGGNTEGAIDQTTISFADGSGSSSAWNEFEVAEQWPGGWNLMRQTHTERDEQRFVVAGKRSDGTTIYLMPDGRAGTSPHTFPTVEEAATAYEQWRQRAENGNTGEDETPDPSQGRPSPEGVTEDVEGRGASGSFDGAFSWVRRNPMMATGAIAGTAVAAYYLYQQGYFDDQIQTLEGVFNR